MKLGISIHMTNYCKNPILVNTPPTLSVYSHNEQRTLTPRLDGPFPAGEKPANTMKNYTPWPETTVSVAAAVE